MKPFHLESKMLTLRGVFYPTGHMVLMFPTEQGMREAARRLDDEGFGTDTISLLTPELIQQELARTIGSTDMPMPSAGTEADTVRRIVELASQGHHGLLIHAPTAAESDRVMEALRGAEISYGQKYRHLVIEDLVD